MITPIRVGSTSRSNSIGFLASLEGYPFQKGSSMSAAGINYRSRKAIQILKQLETSGFPVGR